MKKIIPFSLFLFLFSLTIGQTTYYQGMSYIQTVNHDDYQFALLRPDNSTRNIPYILNNYFQNLDTKGYLLDAGDETPVSTNNNLDGMVISGNKFKWNGTPGAPSTHGMFMGYNINMVVKYNYMDGVPYNILFKSGDASGNNMTCTTGGASYNIVKNPKMGVRSKGQSGVRIYNNTFYNSYSSGTLIYLDGNHDQPAFTSPQGTRIKNNIFYSVYDIPFFYVESGCLTDFQCDYNVYYCQNSTNHYPTFNVNGTSYSWTAWRALGYDTHSVVINPNFNNTTDFVPSARLNYGTDLGSEFNTGLSTSANWVVGTAPATQIQNGTWQVGARIYASTVTPVIPTVTTTPISSITTTTAVSGGNVSSDGNSPVTERGVCWDQAGFPALDNVHTHDGTGTGSFTSNITGLSANTTYYVRAYATNSVGTGYGNTISFTTGQVTPNEGTWFVSTTGNDATGNGSIDSPWFTLNKAWSVAKAGDYIYMRGGTYIYNNEQVLTNKNGTVINPITIVAYQNENPIISPSSAFYTSGYNDGIVIRDCQYIHIKNLEITGYRQPRPDDWGNGITAMDISNCVFENLNIHHGCFGLTLGNDDGITDNNLILNCDFHHNSDPITDFPPPYDQLFAYGNADGLTIRIDGTLGLGTTNYVIGCRMWYNSDDGIDLWSNEGMIVIKDSWAFLNGYYNDTTNPNPGDGNGFKLGLSNIDNHSTVLRKVYNCIGYMNKGWGFVRNGAACNMEIYNNTSYSNGITGYGGGFFFGNDGGPVGDIPFYIKNNIAYSNITNYSFWSNELLQNVDHNTWNLPVTVTNTDFVNLNGSELTLPRQADGSLPEIGFLHLSSGSDLIGKGVEVGIPHDGTNPDLGAFDFKENLPSIFQIIVSRGYTIKTINNARVTTGIQ